MSLNSVQKYFIVTVFLFVQLFENGFAIKCFVCDSSDNPSCADLDSNSSIVSEECTLDKMRSIDTWLFELNKISYFETGANKSPLMNCQKVVARDSNTNKMVTARFCQLNTGDSDACQILRTKLNLPPSDDTRTNTNNNGYNNNNNNGRRNMGQQRNEEDEFFCSICNTDNCNSASNLVGSLLMALMTVPLQQMISRRW